MIYDLYHIHVCILYVSWSDQIRKSSCCVMGQYVLLLKRQSTFRGLKHGPLSSKTHFLMIKMHAKSIQTWNQICQYMYTFVLIVIIKFTYWFDNDKYIYKLLIPRLPKPVFILCWTTWQIQCLIVFVKPIHNIYHIPRITAVGPFRIELKSQHMSRGNI